jgi:hypothetical protein
MASIKAKSWKGKLIEIEDQVYEGAPWRDRQPAGQLPFPHGQNEWQDKQSRRSS